MLLLIFFILFAGLLSGIQASTDDSDGKHVFLKGFVKGSSFMVIGLLVVVAIAFISM